MSIFYNGDENVLNVIMMIAIQICDYKTTEWYTSGRELYITEIISVMKKADQRKKLETDLCCTVAWCSCVSTIKYLMLHLRDVGLCGHVGIYWKRTSGDLPFHRVYLKEFSLGEWQNEEDARELPGWSALFPEWSGLQFRICMLLVMRHCTLELEGKQKRKWQ